MDALAKKQNTLKNDNPPEKANPVKQHFTAELAKRMAALDYNQTDVSVRSDISKDMISRYLNGRALPKDDKLVMLARALQTTPDALLPIRGRAFKYAEGAQRIKIVTNDDNPAVAFIICSIPVMLKDADDIREYLTARTIG